MDWRKETKKAAQEVFDEINDTYFRIREANIELDPEQFINEMRRQLAELAEEWIDEQAEEEEEDPAVDEFEPGRVHWSQFAANP